MLRRYNSVVLFAVAVMTVAAAFVVWPQRPGNYLPFDLPGSPGIRFDLGGTRFDRSSMRLGLDLQGGINLLLQADLSAVEGGRTSEAMEGLRHIIERRVNAFGVSEPIIQVVGNDRISVQLAGIADIDEAKRLIGSTATLEFKQQVLDVNGQPVRDERGFPIWEPATARGPDGEIKALTGKYFRPNAAVIFAQGGLPEVAFEFDSEGARLFEQITTRLIGKPLGIFLDGQLISAPIVQGVLSQRGVITGLSFEEGRQLAIQLNSGALPVPVTIIKEQTIDATLGSDSVQKSVIAGGIGFLLVVLFMVLNYRLPGVLASGALIIYALLTLAIFKLIPVTLTLAGIAGFILSVGMAVDANILIFERTREELRWGRSLAAAIEAGFDRAWTSIRDSNVATLITCFILYQYGSTTGTALVAGFALTLALGVLVSMFTAIIVTKSFMRALIGRHWARNLPLYGVSEVERAGAVPPPRPGWLDFVKRRYVYFAFSLALIVPGLISMAIPPAFKPGIEFSSGTSLSIVFEPPQEPVAIREALASVGFGDAVVQRVGDGAEVLIRVRALVGLERDETGAVVNAGEQALIVDRLRQLPGLASLTVLSADTVSPVIAAETVRNATLAVIVAAIGILIYIWWAFRQVPKPFRYATCAIIAVVHDALLVMGVFSILGKLIGAEVDSLFITAMLTVIGFSVHDTIVVFDRIRENLRTRSLYNLEEAVNESILQTLGRSLNTTLTVLLTLLALLVFGGDTIRTFVLVLVIGITSGTYSSIFNASQLLVVWERGEIPAFVRRLRGPSSAPPPAPGSRRRSAPA